MSDDVSVADFINSLSKAARARGISIVMLYGFTENGRAVMKMSSNTGPEGTAAVLTWVRGMDPEAAAKALYERDCAAWGEKDRTWDDLPIEAKNRVISVAQVVLAAAVANAPRIRDPNAPKLS